MADAVTTQIIHDGRRNVVMKFTNVSDGTGEADVNKVDVSTLSGAPTRVAIERLHYSTQGMSVRIEWDATTDVPVWLCPTDSDGTFDFSHFGGIINDGGAGVTGDVFFTTVGHSAGDTYTIILEMRKDLP